MDNASSQNRLGTERITNAVASHLTEQGKACMREFSLRSGRRVDLIVQGAKRDITIIEVKSSRQDFISDQKWAEYLDWADRFYFAVAEDFPRDILPGPEICGIIITDGFDCHVIQDAPERKLAGQRRNTLIARMAHIAMRRLEFGSIEAAADPADKEPE